MLADVVAAPTGIYRSTRGSKQALKILHINTYDLNGGAAQATHRLHTELRRQGYDSSMLVAEKSSNEPSIIELVPSRDLASRVRRKLRQTQIERSFAPYAQTRPRGYEGFNGDRTVYHTDLRRELPPCDVINLHWIAGLLDYESFFSAVPAQVPIFWRLADMNALTGGCHFDNGCGKHSFECGACPQLGSDDVRDLSHQIFSRKRETFLKLAPERLHFVALSRWMAGLMAKSPLFSRFRTTLIPNGVDTAVFAPRDRRAARNVLGLPQDAKVALFVADGIGNRRKGLAELIGALNELSGLENLVLLSAGRSSVQLETAIPHVQVGHLENRRLLSLVYSAADVYVIPSLQDNQPNTVLEAMACGTPVVGFEAGGICDMIRPGVTGELVPVSDIARLRDAILGVLSNPEKSERMGVACRDIVMTDYRLETQVSRYAALYEEAVVAARARSARS